MKKSQRTPEQITQDILIGIAWCLAWGNEKKSKLDRANLQAIKPAVKDNVNPPQAIEDILNQVKKLMEDLTFPQKLQDIQKKYPELWDEKTKIGLVYGGATKIKNYVFESSNLQEIRGASAILDRINLIDLPAFFGKEKSDQVDRWLDNHFSGLREALIPELIVYSTGGNILAFCPAAWVDDLANAIEKRYTEETLMANSCAVGDQFKLLEIRLGLLQDQIEKTNWLDWYQQNYNDHLVEAYFGKVEPYSDAEIKEKFENVKSFNELTRKLAIEFNKRRNGNHYDNRPSRRYPPMLETHPYLVRDENDAHSAVQEVRYLANNPQLSDSMARKRVAGQQAKRETELNWYYGSPGFEWESLDSETEYWEFGDEVKSWVQKFDDFLHCNGNVNLKQKYYQERNQKVKEALRTGEIGNPSNGFIGLIYADGNNMGGYIQKIKTPQGYAQFSQDIFEATEQSVYHALGEHLHPHQLKDLTDLDAQDRNGTVIHPFEIITIGGDDVMLIVPANKALEIAHTIGIKFEEILLEKEKTYEIDDQKTLSQCQKFKHRYLKPAKPSKCQLSISSGVLITDYKTPIHYGEDLTKQLMKSAKDKAKKLKDNKEKENENESEKAKKDQVYYGGTVDFLTLKSVTMISSNLEGFREKGLTKKQLGYDITLKLYGAPYTLHELAGLLETAKALKKSDFPRSQLYQIRSLLEQGKKTAILNYRYFRVRLESSKQRLLEEHFEQAWCPAKTNQGNLAPWMYDTTDSNSKIYETIWRELVDLYPFIEEEKVTQETPGNSRTTAEIQK